MDQALDAIAMGSLEGHGRQTHGDKARLLKYQLLVRGNCRYSMLSEAEITSLGGHNTK